MAAVDNHTTTMCALSMRSSDMQMLAGPSTPFSPAPCASHAEAAIRASLEACLVTNEEAEAEDGEAWEALEGGEWKQMLGEDDGWLGNRQDAL